MAELALHGDLALVGDADVDRLVDLFVDGADDLEGFLEFVVVWIVFLHVLQHVPTARISTR